MFCGIFSTTNDKFFNISDDVLLRFYHLNNRCQRLLTLILAVSYNIFYVGCEIQFFQAFHIWIEMAGVLRYVTQSVCIIGIAFYCICHREREDFVMMFIYCNNGG